MYTRSTLGFLFSFLLVACSILPSATEAASVARVSLTFDDGWTNHYTNVAPILKAAGQTGTFYIAPGLVNAGVFEGGTIMNWTQVKALYTDGFEIGGHSMTHPELPEIPVAEMRAEISGSYNALVAQGITPKAFATPYGAYNPEVITEIAKYYSSHRPFHDVGYNTWPYTKYLLKVQQITNQTTVAQVEGWITQAKQNGTWLIIVFHEVLPTVASDDTYSWTTAKFQQLMAVLANQGIKTQTVSQAIGSYPNLFSNGGFDSGISGGWTTDNTTQVKADATTQGAVTTPATSVRFVGSSANVHLFGPRTAVTPGHEYGIRAFANTKLLTGGQFGFYLDEYDASGNWLSWRWLGATGLQFAVDHVYSYVPQSASVAFMELNAYLDPGSVGTAFLDAAELFDFAGTPPPPPPSAPTCTLSASPSSIQTGSATTLSWTTANATALSINNGIGSVSLSGSTSTAPTLTTTYTGTVNGAGGTANCTATVTVTAVPPPPPTGSTPIGWWKFDETSGTSALNSAGTPNGTLTNGPTRVAGKIGNALNLDGTNDYVNLGSVSNYNFGTAQSFTVAGWFKTSANKNQRIFHTGFSSCSNGFMVMALDSTQTQGALWGGIGGGGGANCAGVRTVNGYADGAWHHTAWVMDQTAKTITVYVDGVKAPIQKSAGWGSCPTISDNVANYSTCTGINANRTNAVAMGRNSNGTGSEYWNGQLDDMRIYNVALSASAVGDVYAAGGTPPPPPPSAPTCTLSASPSSIQTGSATTLSWTTANATALSINNGIGSVSLSGSTSTAPTATVTYTGTVTGAGGTANCTATVTVTATPPPTSPTCTLSASPASIQTGSATTLSWSTTNATSLSIDNGVGSVALSGSTSTEPTITTTYTGSVNGTGGTASCTTSVTVTATPPPTPLSSIFANSDFANGLADGWRTDSASRVTADASGKGAAPTEASTIKLTGGTTAVHLFSPNAAVTASTYSVRAFANNSALTGGELGFYVDEYDAAGNWISGKWLGQATNGIAQEYTYSYVRSSASVASVSLQVYLALSPVGTAYVDNVRMFLP